MSRALLLAVALLATSCYAPTLEDAQYTCGVGKRCPQGQACGACGYCVALGEETLVDEHTCPGCALGSRSAGDPGLPVIAFCPAAWQVPGVVSAASKATPCNHAPGTNGAKGSVQCSIEDSCAEGWHVCRNDADANRGFNGSECADAENHKNLAGLFWVTRQVVNGLAVPPACSASAMSGLVAGCGSTGKPDASCDYLTRYQPVSQCMIAPWSCTVLPTPADSLIKMDAATGGGVICCRGG